MLMHRAALFIAAVPCHAMLCSAREKDALNLLFLLVRGTDAATDRSSKTVSS
jgi:hypothetical protein